MPRKVSEAGQLQSQALVYVSPSLFSSFISNVSLGVFDINTSPTRHGTVLI